jgi:hypothetical protein
MGEIYPGMAPVPIHRVDNLPARVELFAAHALGGLMTGDYDSSQAAKIAFGVAHALDSLFREQEKEK